MGKNMCRWWFVQEDDLGDQRVYSRVFEAEGTCENLLYIDVTSVNTEFEDPAVFADTLAKLLSRLPSDVLNVELIVLREYPSALVSDVELAAAQETLAQRVGRVPTLSVLRTPSMSGSFSRPQLDILKNQEYGVPARTLDALRALEFHAYLDWSNAVSTPADAHFELPTGAHASAFVRVADAFTSHKQVARVADWIQHHVTAVSVLIVDTWTILPLAQELAFRAFKVFGREPAIYSFPSYPTLGRIERMFNVISPILLNDPNSSVTFIMSVVASRAFYDRVLTIGPERMDAVVLVDASFTEGGPESFVNIENISRYDVSDGEVCELCRNPEKTHVVRIDSRRYSPVVSPAAEQVMLSQGFASRHSRFWEIARAESAVSLHHDLVDFNTGHRRHVPIFLDVSRLLSNSTFLQRSVAALIAHSMHCDLVIIPDTASTEALTKLARRAYGEPRIHIVRRESEQSGEDEHADARSLLAPHLVNVHNIVILDDSLTHGHTMRALHRLIQDTYTQTDPQANYQIRGFVVLGRPTSESLWQRLEASLRQAAKQDFLGCTEKLLIPNAALRCPWCIERDILKQQRDWLTSPERWPEIEARTGLSPSQISEASSVVRTRLEILSPVAQAHPLGLSDSIYVCRYNGQIEAAQAEQISPHSLFGENLDEATAYAAVATAMQEIRDTWTPGSNVLRGWAVAKILTAYHDPLLSAAFLRAAYSEEIIGLGRDSDVEAALDEISFASPNPRLRQSPLLAGELKWAMLSGKISLRVWNKFAVRIEPLIEPHTNLNALLTVARTSNP